MLAKSHPSSTDYRLLALCHWVRSVLTADSKRSTLYHQSHVTFSMLCWETWYARTIPWLYHFCMEYVNLRCRRRINLESLYGICGLTLQEGMQIWSLHRICELTLQKASQFGVSLWNMRNLAVHQRSNDISKCRKTPVDFSPLFQPITLQQRQQASHQQTK